MSDVDLAIGILFLAVAYAIGSRARRPNWIPRTPIDVMLPGVLIVCGFLWCLDGIT